MIDAIHANAMLPAAGETFLGRMPEARPITGVRMGANQGAFDHALDRARARIDASSGAAHPY